MKNFFKGKVATAIILLATLVLAGVAIFTAIRLYELRQTSVAPNVPSSLPKAADVTPPADQTKACNLSFSITLASSSPTPTPTPTPTSPPGSSPTPTPTVTPTPTSPPGAPNNCNGTCGSNANCSAGYMCYQGFCRNASCVTSTNCVCPGTPAPTATPAALPQSGTDWPSVLGIGIGILTIIGSLILAL